MQRHRLTELGLSCLRRRDVTTARSLFALVADVDPEARYWSTLLDADELVVTLP